MSLPATDQIWPVEERRKEQLLTRVVRHIFNRKKDIDSFIVIVEGASQPLFLLTDMLKNPTRHELQEAELKGRRDLSYRLSTDSDRYRFKIPGWADWLDRRPERGWGIMKRKKKIDEGRTGREWTKHKWEIARKPLRTSKGWAARKNLIDKGARSGPLYKGL